MAPKTVECLAHDGALPEFDYHYPMLSLPLHFNTDADTIPAKRAYLSASAERVAQFQAQSETKKRLRVGLVWSGNATHQRNMFRSVGLERYAQTLGNVQNVAFFSLQKGAEQEVSVAREAGFEIVDHTGAFESFDDTAAFIETLDLVITVCTRRRASGGGVGQAHLSPARYQSALGSGNSTARTARGIPPLRCIGRSISGSGIRS
jgi:hypothetical protein